MDNQVATVQLDRSPGHLTYLHCMQVLCAVASAEDGRWRTARCSLPLPTACRDARGRWLLSAGQRGACPAGFSFQVLSQMPLNARMRGSAITPGSGRSNLLHYPYEPRCTWQTRVPFQVGALSWMRAFTGSPSCKGECSTARKIAATCCYASVDTPSRYDSMRGPRLKACLWRFL